MNILVYRIFINLKKRIVRVPDLALTFDIPADMTFEETFAFAREMIATSIQRDYLSKHNAPPEPDAVKEKKGSGDIETYIDINMEMFQIDVDDIEKSRVYNMMNVKENVIEWIGSSDVVTFTLCQQKAINRIKKIAEQDSKHAKILIENEDGSIYGKMSRSCLRLQAPVSKEYTEEEKIVLRERLAAARQKKGEGNE